MMGRRGLVARPRAGSLRTQAAVCRSFGGPLQIEDVMISPPGPGETLIRIMACAICHSDVAFIDGAWGGPLPAVYGHEAAGVVARTGPGAGGLAAGDHVVVTLVRSCGRCARCRAAQPALCEAPPGQGEGSVLSDTEGKPIHQGMHTGAFARLVTVHTSQAVVVPPAIPFDVASLLACGVLTGVGAVRHTASVEHGSTVVVLGAGGVGLNCVQGARLAGAAEIIAADLVAAKLETARTLGATQVTGAAGQDLVDDVRQLAGGRGADYVFVAAAAPGLIEAGSRMLRRGGTLVLVGIPPAGATVTLDPVAIADGSLRILGSKMGASRPQADIPELAALYRAGQLKLGELVSGRYEFGRIDDAVAAAREGTRLRTVIVFGTGGDGPERGTAWRTGFPH